jgi:hypothetical protein
MENSNIKKTLQELREHYAAEKIKLHDVDKLAGEAVDREIVTDFWKLSGTEIEGEMFRRLSVLDLDADCLPGGPIASHRRLIGKPIVLFKKLIRRLAAPYSAMLLEKQNRLNRELVTFQLLSFLKFRHLDRRLRNMEEKLADLSGHPKQEAEMDKRASRRP